MELFFDGEALPLARWPNTGFVRMASVDTSSGYGAGGGSRVKRVCSGAAESAADRGAKGRWILQRGRLIGVVIGAG